MTSGFASVHNDVRALFSVLRVRIEGGHGIWNMPSNPEDNQGIGRGTPTANYPVVKATNADAAVWGDLLIKSKQCVLRSCHTAV